MNKKGISPLIASVLLIGFTIVLAFLVFKWGGELFEKPIDFATYECGNEYLIKGVPTLEDYELHKPISIYYFKSNKYNYSLYKWENDKYNFDSIGLDKNICNLIGVKNE